MPNQLARSIGERATPSAELAPFPILPAEGDHTTHLSALDAAGGAVALTYTLEDRYGAKCVVAGAGFLLNNEMGDFNLIPGRTDVRGWIGTPANRIEPRKRMLSSQAPTLVLKDGRVRRGDRLAGRPDDPQHDAVGRAQRPGIRPRPPGGRRRPADPPSVVPRRRQRRGTRLAQAPRSRP